jgi:hypothetical protein
MEYDYEKEKPWLATLEAQEQLFRMRDWIRYAIRTHGAFTAGKALGSVSTPDTFKALALLDRLVELGHIEELPGQTCVTQHRVYRWTGSGP